MSPSSFTLYGYRTLFRIWLIGSHCDVSFQQGHDETERLKLCRLYMVIFSILFNISLISSLTDAMILAILAYNWTDECYQNDSTLPSHLLFILCKANSQSNTTNCMSSVQFLTQHVSKMCPENQVQIRTVFYSFI